MNLAKSSKLHLVSYLFASSNYFKPGFLIFFLNQVLLKQTSNIHAPLGSASSLLLPNCPKTAIMQNQFQI